MPASLYIYLYIHVSVCFSSGLPDAAYSEQQWDPEQCVAEQWSPWQHGTSQADQPPEESEQRLVPLPETDAGPDRGRISGPEELQLQGEEDEEQDVRRQ